MKRAALAEAGIAVLLLALPLLLFAPVSLGAKTLLPADILFQFEPYRSSPHDFRVPSYPQNHLVADLILENYAWKSFVLRAIENRELPLWDPNTFAGHPFLANGQHSALYPLSLVFYVLPLWRAYGVFVWLQLGLAGVFAYLLARVLGTGRLAGLVAGITFQFSGFMVVSVVHPMVIAGASWLPMILAMVELVVQQRPAFGRPTTLPWMVLGALALGCQMLAGHAENTYFVLLVTGAFAAWRLSTSFLAGKRGNQRFGGVGRKAVWLCAMVVLGLALGAVQFVPLYEVVVGSFRGGEGSASLDQVLSWAYPWRRLITFGIPNFFGNPSHHSYYDLFEGRTMPACSFPDGQYIDWGIKNYVEGGAYLGLLPMLLAIVAVASWLRPLRARAVRLFGRMLSTRRGLARSSLPTPTRGRRDTRGLILFFALLALFSLACMYGTRVYALVYLLPGLQQSHSPFRWVFPLTLSVAVLAAFGTDVIRRRRAVEGGRSRASTIWRLPARILLLGAPPSTVSLLAATAFWGGLGTLAGLALSFRFFQHVELFVARAFYDLALARSAFHDHRAFYSYEFVWVAVFGAILVATGAVLRLSQSRSAIRGRPVWEGLAVVLLLLDFISFGAGFNPAVDPALLTYVPPAIEFLEQDATVWRFASFTPAGTTKTMNANIGMSHSLQDVAGYDSLFSRQYADYMALIGIQDELQYNRISTLRAWPSLDSPLLDLLNVKYVVSEVEIPNAAKYRLVYEDESVWVYENLAVMPRAFSLPASAAVVAEDVTAALRTYDPHHYVIVEPAEGASFAAVQPNPAELETATIARYSGNEVVVETSPQEDSWLVLADSFAPGWKAFVRPSGGDENAELQIDIHRVYGNFRGVRVEPGRWMIRFRYSPDSVKLGAFITFIALMVVLLLTGIYLWRFFYRVEDDESTVRRVAKNSIAPIVINLFTRLIEMAFAALAARILGPVGLGRYATAISIYLWFDTIANFGLDMYAMREVARDRSRTRVVFANTTVLRVLLFIGIAPLLAGFLTARQSLGEPLAPDTIWATILLYAGLLPFSVANGLAALFRAYEKHEYPAVIQTITTIVKVTLGVLVLAGGIGIVGLAGAAILTNVATLAILAILARRLIWSGLPPGETKLAWRVQGVMLSESWPLMTSLLLQVLFPTLNVLLLQSLKGDAVVGWYDAARKWVDAFNIVPAFFTFAVFPVMSRQATEDRPGLASSYRLSVKLLTVLTVPLSICLTLLASPMVGLLSGSRFLPQGADVLRVLIWSSLFGWINGLTNYVLIAIDRQRYVLVASGARIVFTLVANLALVGRFGQMASAAVIVGGELLLAVLFTIDLRRQLGSLDMGRALVRPLLAGLAMGGAALALASVSRVVAVGVGLVTYAVALAVLRILTPQERALLGPLIPARLRSALAQRGGRASRLV